MKALIVLTALLLTLSASSFGQASKAQGKLLLSAYQEDDSARLLEFIHKWQSDISNSRKAISNETIRCLYDVVRDLMTDTNSKVRSFFASDKANGKYQVFPAKIKYGVVKELDPDSVILHALLRLGRHDDSATNAKDIARFFKNGGHQDDMYMDNFYDVSMPDSLLDSLNDFYPDIKPEYLFADDSYEKLFFNYLDEREGVHNNRKEFLEKYIYIPLKQFYQQNNIDSYFITTLLIDSKQQWALMHCSGYGSGSTSILHKEDKKWKLLHSTFWIQ